MLYNDDWSLILNFHKRNAGKQLSVNFSFSKDPDIWKNQRTGVESRAFPRRKQSN